MKKYLFSLIGLFLATVGIAQVSTDPFCFSDTDEITITYDATKGTSGLVGASKVYMHAGVITDSPSGTGWNHVIGNWGQDDGVGQMTKVAGATNLWEITLTPRTYFNVPSNETIYRLGMVFRNADGSKEGKSDANGDIFVDLADGPISLTINSTLPKIVNNAETITIEANTCSPADFVFYLNDVEENASSGNSTYSYSYQVTQVAGEEINAKLVATVGADSEEVLFTYSVRQPSIEEPRPQGIVDGINYGADPSKVTLSLWAPIKSSVYVVGDFNDWAVSSDYQLKRDGEHFWLELTGLTPGQEYAYQYWVDETVWIADPYADKILDPDDKWIPSSTYPNLMPYPTGAQHSAWYFNRASVFQTNQQAYSWQNTNFEKPEKEKLVIYELLVRDFLGEDNMNYQALIDTLGYLEGMGVNAIELMPIMEFNGNDSWGYNPAFMFAVDKAYGTKNDLKEFIDECHGRGIAVILDMVMNQNDIPSPYAQMYFDFTDFKPTSDNPWFNVTPKHPYNVFFDINHESDYTKAWLDTINHYWINEFHFDGYRFDLSKGFTQKNTYPDNVGGWGNKDDSRIAILKRMADQIWAHSPDAYVILEHFADNSEELILSDYGMMLWSGFPVYESYVLSNIGFGSNRSLGLAYYKNRAWNKNGLVSYMESHDEERQMYLLKNNSNFVSNYSIRELSTGLQRLKLSATFFFLVPGPKMFWQFGEFGYDVSIDENGRTGRKPTKWQYLDDIKRSNVRDVYTELIGLRNKYDVFTEGEFSWLPYGNGKSMHITKGDTSVVVIGNYDVLGIEINPEFQETGTWYDFFSSGEFTVADVSEKIYLNPGEFHIYTNKKLHSPNYDIITGIEEDIKSASVSLYPNPTSDIIYINLEDYRGGVAVEWVITDLFGKKVKEGITNTHQGISCDVTELPSGLYTIQLSDGQRTNVSKFIRE